MFIETTIAGTEEQSAVIVAPKTEAAPVAPVAVLQPVMPGMSQRCKKFCEALDVVQCEAAYGDHRVAVRTMAKELAAYLRETN